MRLLKSRQIPGDERVVRTSHGLLFLRVRRADAGTYLCQSVEHGFVQPLARITLEVLEEEKEETEEEKQAGWHRDASAMEELWRGPQLWPNEAGSKEEEVNRSETPSDGRCHGAQADGGAPAASDGQHQRGQRRPSPSPHPHTPPPPAFPSLLSPPGCVLPGRPA